MKISGKKGAASAQECEICRALEVENAALKIHVARLEAQLAEAMALGDDLVKRNRALIEGIRSVSIVTCHPGAEMEETNLLDLVMNGGGLIRPKVLPDGSIDITISSRDGTAS